MVYSFGTNLFLSQLAAQIMGVATAIVSVLITFYFYRLKSEINALRALNEEITNNMNIAIEGLDVLEEEGNMDQNKERTDAVENFQTTAFENIKNTGVLFRLSNDTQKAITNHYSQISWINRQITYRENMRAGAGRAMSGYNQRKDNLDILLRSAIKVLTENIEEDADTDSVIEADLIPSLKNEESAVSFYNITQQIESDLSSYKTTNII